MLLLTCPRNQCTSGWLRDAQTLHEKGLSAYLRASAWGAGTSFNTHLGVFWGKRLLGAIFTCSLLLFRVPISSKRKLLHTSCALVFMSSATVFMAVGWRACIPGSHGTVTIKDIVLGQLPCSGHSRDNRVKYNPSLSVKDAFCFFWSFGVRCRHLVWHTSSSLLRLLQEEKAGGRHLWTLLLPGFSLPVSPRKKLVYISPAPCFLWLSQGTLIGHLAVVASTTYACGPPKCMYLHNLKAAAWSFWSRSWLRSSSLGHWWVLAHP